MRQIPRYLIKNISFIIIGSKLDNFREIFSTLKNQACSIYKYNKAYYRALCIMSGNFTMILWLKLFKELGLNFNISKAATFSYLNSIVSNLFLYDKCSLTTPIGLVMKKL